MFYIIKNFKNKIIKFIKKDFIKQYVENIIGIIILIIASIFLVVNLNKVYKRDAELRTYEKELKEHPRNSYTGKRFVTENYPIFTDVMLIGDSYAHFVSCDLGFDMTNYSSPGLTLSQLRYVFDSALKIKKKYVTIFIGPNDFRWNTPLEDFKNTLIGYIKEIREKMGAKVIVCTYLHSTFSDNVEKIKIAAHSIDEYNEEIKKLEDEKNGIYFLDLSELDEHEKYRKTDSKETDDMYYNYYFNVKFINKLYDKIMYIRKNEIENG